MHQTNNFTVKPLVLASALVLAGGSQVTFAAVDNDTLQREIIELQTKLNNLQGQLATNKNETQTVAMQNKPESKLTLTKSGVDISAYGFIRTDAKYQASGANVMFNNMNVVPLDGTADAKAQKQRLMSTINGTRLGLNFTAPTEDKPVTAKLEVDFTGGATRDQFRIRHAYLSYDHWLVGQTWSTFVAPEFMPESIDMPGYVGGATSRVPMVRYQSALSPTSSFAVSLQDPQYTTASDPGSKMQLPELAARIAHSFLGGKASMAARSFAEQKKTINDSALGWGVALGGKINIDPKTLLSADYYHVVGDGREVLWSNAGYSVTPANTLVLNHFDTVSLGLTHQFNEKIRSTWGGGYMQADDHNAFARLNLKSTVQNKSLWQSWLNVMYTPIKHITVGAEYVYGQRETFAGLKGTDNRINMMASYNF